MIWYEIPPTVTQLENLSNLSKHFELKHSNISIVHFLAVGIVVNHTVVLAQLIIDGDRCGPQAFLVQIRDRDTHEPMPGNTITILSDFNLRDLHCIMGS